MRVSQVQTQTRHRVMSLDLDHGIETVRPSTVEVHNAPAAEVDRDQVTVETDQLYARAGGDGELVGSLQALTAQVSGEHPTSVAAHLGGAAIGVAIVHEPTGLGTLVAHVLLGCSLCRDDTDDTVGTDACPAVGEASNMICRHVARTIEIGNQHEVVLGAVALGEMQLAGVSHLAYCCSPEVLPPSR